MIFEGKELIRDEVIFPNDCYESVSTPKKNGVLRSIKGPVAEWDNLNRNQRKYTERLWDNVLESQYVTEQKEHKTLYGEANHPDGRFEVDFERVSHSITEMWKVPDKKQIYAKIDILDTPLGRILNTLYEYGSVIGYSSRAGGVLHKRKDYVEVDEKSYHFVTFDAVPYPSVKSARPVNESGNDNDPISISEDAHQKIIQIIEESGKKDRKVLRDFIYNLEGYNLDKEIAVLEGLDVESTSSESLKDTTLCLLKESYKQISNLKSEHSNYESKLLESENLANDYKTKLASSLEKIQEMVNEHKSLESINEENINLKSQVGDLSEKNNILLNTIKEYEESLDESDLKVFEMECLQNDLKKRSLIIETYSNEKQELQSQIKNLIVENTKLQETVVEFENYSDYEDISEGLKNSKMEIISLKESYNHCNSLLESKNREVAKLGEELNGTISDIETLTNAKLEVDTVVEQFETSLNESRGEVKNLQTTIKSLNENVKVAESKISEYKKDLLKAVCENYGVNSHDVIEKVGEDYTLGDLHIVCDSVDAKPLEVVSIESSEPIVIDEATQFKEIKKAKLGEMFTSSRRGILK